MFNEGFDRQAKVEGIVNEAFDRLNSDCGI